MVSMCLDLCEATGCFSSLMGPCLSHESFITPAGVPRSPNSVLSQKPSVLLVLQPCIHLLRLTMQLWAAGYCSPVKGGKHTHVRHPSSHVGWQNLLHHNFVEYSCLVHTVHHSVEQQVCSAEPLAAVYDMCLVAPCALQYSHGFRNVLCTQI